MKRVRLTKSDLKPRRKKRRNVGRAQRVRLSKTDLKPRRKKRRNVGRASKAKGAAFERKVCQRLSLWVSGMKREDLFWRSAMSGGRATVKKKKSSVGDFSKQVGDISMIHRLGDRLLRHFTVEAKHIKSIGVEAILWGYKANTDNIWWKPLEEAHAVDRHPMVIAKQNRKQEFVMTTKRGWGLLQRCLRSGATLQPSAIFPRIGMYVILLDGMISDVDPTMLGRLTARKPVPVCKPS